MNRFPIDIIGNYGMWESVMNGDKLEVIRTETYTVDREYFEKKLQLI